MRTFVQSLFHHQTEITDRLLRGGFLGLAIAVTLASCGPNLSPEPISADPGDQTQTSRKIQPIELPDLGPAPELTNEVWLNTQAPLRIADLNGKVILLDFWTFG
jgi:hypothetical protein